VRGARTPPLLPPPPPPPCRRHSRAHLNSTGVPPRAARRRLLAAVTVVAAGVTTACPWTLRGRLEVPSPPPTHGRAPDPTPHGTVCRNLSAVGRSQPRLGGRPPCPRRGDCLRRRQQRRQAPDCCLRRQSGTGGSSSTRSRGRPPALTPRSFWLVPLAHRHGDPLCSRARRALRGRPLRRHLDRPRRRQCCHGRQRSSTRPPPAPPCHCRPCRPRCRRPPPPPERPREMYPATHLVAGVAVHRHQAALSSVAFAHAAEARCGPAAAPLRQLRAGRRGGERRARRLRVAALLRPARWATWAAVGAVAGWGLDGWAGCSGGQRRGATGAGGGVRRLFAAAAAVKGPLVAAHAVQRVGAGVVETARGAHTGCEGYATRQVRGRRGGSGGWEAASWAGAPSHLRRARIHLPCV